MKKYEEDQVDNNDISYYIWFHIKGTWNVYSFNGLETIYLFLSAQVAVGTFFYEIPSTSIVYG